MSEFTTHTFSYPVTEKVSHADDYHGTEVPDPYRWLEDDNSPATKEWVQKQNDVTFAYLNSLPRRDAIRDRMTELWDNPRTFAPVIKNGISFFFRNDGLQNQPVLCRKISEDSEAEVVLDPNTFSEDGTIALTSSRVSDDARLLAYATAVAGSDWQTIHVRDLETGEDLEDTVEWVKFSVPGWTKDGKGFIYSRYPEPDQDQAYSQLNIHHSVYYHRLGTSQDQDILVHRDADNPKLNFYTDLSDDGRYLYLIISGNAGPGNKLGYIDLLDPLAPQFDGPLVLLTGDLEGSFHPIGNDGGVFYLQTDLNAPRGKVIRIDTAQPSPDNWQDIIPEGPDTLANTSLVQDRFFLTFLQNAHNVVRMYDIHGAFIKELEMPAISSISEVPAARESDDLYYMITSYLFPTTVYRYRISTDSLEPYFEPEIDFDPEKYQVAQLWFPSKDGTQIPMTVTHKKGLELNGQNPTILYGYGGFNTSLTPVFSVHQAVWMEMGGVYAVVNLRGGGEFGDEWYRAGIQEKKQNVFDDFIAAAEHLIENGYTSPEYLAIRGGSNGGLLVGAVMTQRPDLMAVATPAVGVMDMLRYHLFTIGRAWAQDYGTSEDPDMFSVLYAYSPLHNLKEGTDYPATLVITGDHDDRVVPAHSFKFAARLQECQHADRPTLIRIETRGGHGMGKPLSLVIAERADELAFTLANMPQKG